jgi:hypothetical protein
MNFKKLTILIILVFGIHILNSESIYENSNSSQPQNQINLSSNQVLYNKRHNKEVKFLNYGWIAFRIKVRFYF